jgi:protocatechuate 3,4-dioxygenase beta subunit
MFTRLSLVALSLLAVSLLSVNALAQSGTSAITGVVRDSSGQPIPGATIVIVNEQTATSTPTLSDEQGTWRLATLAPGPYGI